MSNRFAPSRTSSLTPWGNGLWQWYNWRWPFAAHQYTTRTVWTPATSWYRNRAWQPDVSGWTMGRFSFDMQNWSQVRGADPSTVLLDMRTASVVQRPYMEPPPEPPPDGGDGDGGGPPPEVDMVLRGYLAGLTLSGGGSQTLTIGSGICASDDATFWLQVTGGTKNFGAWVAGSGLGALDTGFVAPNTWYHVYAIMRTDTAVVDILFSKNPTAGGSGIPAMPPSYDKRRRIGSILTDASSNIVPFSQLDDEFLWQTAFLDANTTVSGNTLFPLTVPVGVKVRAILSGSMATTVGGDSILVTSPDTIAAPSNLPNNFTSAGTMDSFYPGTASQWHKDIRTDTSGRIRAGAHISSTGITLTTRGWIDRRGRFD